jgi:hypothetical protein
MSPPQMLKSCSICSCVRRQFGLYFYIVGPCSSVVIVTDYRLDGPGYRISVGAKFFAHVQTGAGAHPASCTMGTGYFRGVKLPGHGADHPSLLAPM